MIRYRIALAASVLLATVHCTTSQSPPGTELTPPRDGASSALTVPASAGNGPYAMVVCPSRSGNDCNTGNTIASAANFNVAISQLDPWFATASLPIGFGAVHSWALGQSINFWSYTGTFPNAAGPFFGPDVDMDIDDRSMFPLAAQTLNNQAHFQRVFSGFIALPAGSSTTRTFAVAADDGYFLAIGTNPGTVTISQFPAAAHPIAYSTQNAVGPIFASTTQLYPFVLGTYTNAAVSAVEFAWADGALATNTLPSLAANVWSKGTFSLVPGAQMYSPDVRATMTWTSDVPAAANKTVTFHARVENVGPVPAFSAGDPPDVPASCPATQGLCFTLLLPVSAFNAGSLGTVTVNGATVTPAVKTNATNALVAFPLGVDSLPAGAVVTVEIPVNIAAGALGTIRAQGRVTGHATDPTLIAGAAVSPSYTLAVLTNDPTLSEPGDSGNRPSGLRGFAPEDPASTPSPVALISTAIGTDDDDPTTISIGSVAPTTSPTVNSISPVLSSLNAVPISGTATTPMSMRVVLQNSQAPITQALCNALPVNTWSWDTENGVCACVSKPTSPSWQCDPAALPDCPGTGACYTATAAAGDAAGDNPFVAGSTSQSFGMVAATTTVVASASGTFHAISLSGTANANGGAVDFAKARGVNVTAAMPPGVTGACTPGTNLLDSNGNWSCDALLTCQSPPCIVDGPFTVTASLFKAINAGGSPNASGPVVTTSFTVDTRPILSGPATTNSQKPVFRGNLNVGAKPPKVLICDAASTACAADSTAVLDRPLCGNGVDAITFTATSWTCQPSANIPVGVHTVVAYEVDGSRGLSAATPAQLLLVNTLRPTLNNFPASKLFNIATSTLIGGNTCAPGETVNAVFNGSTALGSAGCSGPCNGTGTNGSWSCVAAIPPIDRITGISIVVSQTAADNLVLQALLPTAGFIVDTLAPRAPTIAAPTNGAATRQTSPALQITAAEAGGTLAVSVLDGAGTEVAKCPSQAVSTSLAVTCSPTPALADGVYTLAAVQTDLAANPSAPGTSTLRVKTRTATPLLSSQLVGKTLANPVHVDGTAEPGASVVVKIDDGAPLAAVTADASGHFSASAGIVATGSHFVDATATDSLGNTAQSSREQFNVSLEGHLAGSSFGCSSAGGSGTFGALLLLGLVPLLGRRRSRKGMALAVAVAAGAGAARADGTDLGLDNFRPATGGDGTIGVEGARPLEDGEASWEARGLLVGQNKSLVFVPDGGAEAQTLIRNRIGGWLTGQGHVWGPLSLGVQLPFLVQQSGDLSGLPSNVSGGAVLGGGLGDLRTTMRAAILRQERAGFDLAMQGSFDLPTAKKQSFLGDSSLQGEALAAAGYRWAFSQRSALDLLTNLYFRFRPERDVLGVKTGDELGLRAGLAWLPGGGPLAPKRVILEIEGAAFLRAGFGDGSVPGEWRGGVSYCAGPMTLDFALGGALSSGIGTPGLRIIGGVGFSPSVCGSNARGAPVRPPSPVHLTEAAPPAAQAKPETAPVAAPSSPRAEARPAPVVAAAAAAPKTGAKDVTMLPLPDLPPLPPAKAAKKQKRTVASAEPMPSMPALPAVSVMPLPAPAPSASLSGDRVEMAKPVAFSGSQVPSKEPTLDGVAHLLTAHPEIELVGISAPDDAHAKSVVAYLSKNGVSTKRLRAEGRSDAVEIKVLRRR
jgi:hypothetical protein